jgi:hypothetical protein
MFLDVMKICMDFDPYDAFASSDDPKMVDQQNSVELVSNRHLFSISCMKCRHVNGKYIHFMSTNNLINKRVMHTSTYSARLLLYRSFSILYQQLVWQPVVNYFM